MENQNNKQAIQPIFKSLRLRKLRNKENLTEGLKLIDKVNVGVIFPFERTQEDIVNGIKTILGFSYGRKIFFYWIPKLVRIKEMLFEKKPIKIINKIIDISQILETLTSKKTTYFKRVKKNYLYDFSSILSQIFPEFNNVQKWNSPLAYRNIDDFILEWMGFVIENPVNEKNKTIITSAFMYGGGVHTVHKKVLMGVNIKTKSTSLVKYLNPSIISLPRLIKNNLENYIPLVLLKSIIAGTMGIKEDIFLTKLYSILKDISIVFYNDRGYSFIYNTSEDENVKKMNGNEILTRVKTLFQMLISTNDLSSPDIEEEIDDEEKQQIVNIKQDNIDNIIKVDEFNDIMKVVVNSKFINKKILSKKIKKDEDDEIINEIDEDEENIDKNIDEIEDDFPEDDVEEIDETESGMVDEEINEEEIKTDDIKKIISTINKEIVPKQTSRQQQKLEIVKEKYKSITIEGKSLPEILNDTKNKIIEKETIAHTSIKDESIKSSTLIDFEKSYIKNTLEHDIISTIKSFSNNKTINLHIVDIQKEDTSDQNNYKYTYTFKFIDDRNKNHTIRIDIPKIDDDGFLLIGGNKKILKKQLTLLPVVKYKPDEVMISSNYNKCFIYRNGTVLTRGISILNKFLSKELQNNENFKFFIGDNEKDNKNFITNIEYDTFATKYYKFIIGPSINNCSEYIFNQREIRKIISEKFKNYEIKPNLLPIGINWKERKIIDVDLNNESKNVTNYIINDIKKFNIIQDIDRIISNINVTKKRMYTKIEVQSRDYALIGFLGALYGLTKIINTEKIEVEFSDKKIVGDNRLFIKFSDGYLYYKDSNIASSLLLNGLSYIDTESYSIADFDTEEPYINYFYELTNSRNVFKGHTAFKDLFIDSITEEVLKDLNLPIDFLELFLYANSLLSDNSFSNETSLENYRIRGYENIATLLYKTISSQYRLYKQNSTGNGRISIQQDSIMSALHKSFILENYDGTNPINELKSKAVVTFKGPGGVNNDRVFTLEKRSYDYSAIGTMAISSAEGGPVGIVKHLTVNPNIISTRGYIKITESENDVKKYKLGNISSPEEIDVPFLNLHDDPKRIGISSSQTKHIIKSEGATIPVISTGMDKASPYMVGNTYVPKAKNDGKIIKVDEKRKLIIIQYDNNVSESIKLGLDIQRNSSYFFGNILVPNVKEGQTVKKGDILAYEKEFYKKDIFGNVRSTQGVLAKLVVHEKSTTDEDSFTMTQNLAEKMATSVILRKQISLSKNTNLISYKNIGDHIFKSDPLMVFEESEDDYTAELLTTLGNIDEDILASAKQTPKANATGEIVDIKVYFTIPLEELSDSLYDFIIKWSKSIKSDIKFKKENSVNDIDLENMLKVTKPNVTGTSSRINGAIMNNDGGVLIEYFIKHKTIMTIGDKSTANANIKNIVASVISNGEEPLTEDGIKLDGVVSLMSIYARMTYSLLNGGVMTHCLVEKSKQIAREFLDLEK